MSRKPRSAKSRNYRTVALAILVMVLIFGAVVAANNLFTISKHIGINYLTLYHQYNTSNARLQHDFALFAKNGINTIVISLYWYRIELSTGVYDKQFISNITRIIRIADSYGLSVMVDFHTLIGEADAWSNPSYVGAGKNLISQSKIAQAYVAMVKWTVNQLKGLPNIWAYSVLNEPWYSPLESWRKTAWINLIVQLSDTVKAVDAKPVTVRFIGALFDRDWTWNPELINSLDFLSMNAFLNDDPNQSIYWNTWGRYKAELRDVAQNATALRKPVQITEFGYSTPNDAIQEAMYKEYVGVFNETPNLTGWLSWGWDSSYDSNSTWTAIGDYSIDVQSTGIPRPAYYALCQAAC